EEPQADEAADEEHEPHHIHPDSMADRQPWRWPHRAGRLQRAGDQGEMARRPPDLRHCLASAAAATFDDPENARTIHLVAAALIIIGIGLAAATAWWWVTSRVEHPSLGPLEVMSTRRWRDADPGLRRVRLDAARPIDESTAGLRLAEAIAERSPVVPRSSGPVDPLLKGRAGD
ncbi:MAG: hypothetical protein RJB61_2325, partial [Actinomycetota bacterium]